MRKIYFEYKISFGYLLLGCMWIIFSDRILRYFINDADILTQLQTYKGWFFILFTTFLLHAFLKNHLKKLREAQKKAKESDNLKTAFIQNISHEIRTPMNGIIGFSSLLVKDGTPPSERERYADIVTRSTHQLLSIVDEILELSLIQLGEIKVQERALNLNVLLDEIYLTNSPYIKSDVIFSVQKGVLDEKNLVFVDDVKLKEIFKSLLNNANKFTDRGQISFGYALKNSELEFYVKDSGMGVAPEIQNTIFNSFQKAGNLNKLYDGVGLGLSICRGYLNLLKGKIWVESIPNQGSTFYFTIPYKPQHHSVQLVTQSSHRFDNLNFLVVEDDEINFLYMSMILSDLGIVPLRALNGKEAVDMCEKNMAIDFIFMDVKMPIMNGYEATKLIRQFNPTIPIIAQTVHGFSSEKEDLLRAGCNDYIIKPFDRGQVLAVINRYIMAQ